MPPPNHSSNKGNDDINFRAIVPVAIDLDLFNNLEDCCIALCRFFNDKNWDCTTSILVKKDKDMCFKFEDLLISAIKIGSDIVLLFLRP